MTILINPQKNISKEDYLYDARILPGLKVGAAISLMKRHRPTAKIGFTNGCFSILHPGHCVFLSLCRSKCDLLIVGLNSDYSLRLLGKESPFSTQERAFAVASISGVDYVCPFDEETPAVLINQLGISCVFKGYDYKGKDVVSNGIAVEIIEHPFNIHTSDILKSSQDSGNKFFKI